MHGGLRVFLLSLVASILIAPKASALQWSSGYSREFCSGLLGSLQNPEYKFAANLRSLWGIPFLLAQISLSKTKEQLSEEKQARLNRYLETHPFPAQSRIVLAADMARLSLQDRQIVLQKLIDPETPIPFLLLFTRSALSSPFRASWLQTMEASLHALPRILGDETIDVSTRKKLLEDFLHRVDQWLKRQAKHDLLPRRVEFLKNLILFLFIPQIVDLIWLADQAEADKSKLQLPHRWQRALSYQLLLQQVFFFNPPDHHAFSRLESSLIAENQPESYLDKQATPTLLYLVKIFNPMTPMTERQRIKKLRQILKTIETKDYDIRAVDFFGILKFLHAPGIHSPQLTEALLKELYRFLSSRMRQSFDRVD